MNLPILPTGRFDQRVAQYRTETDCVEERSGGVKLISDRVTTLQINLGLRCNLACKHCHVDSSPKRSSDSENMQPETANRVIEWLRATPQIRQVDLTGGSPEMNASFRKIVEAASKELGCHVMDRCNPTILVHQEPNDQPVGGHYGQHRDYAWVPEFLADHQVEVFASLPCYLEDNVRAQRGKHAYNDSIRGLKLLCDVGYGRTEDLPLNLVFNPVGPSLPPAADNLETDYRNYLAETFDLHFTRLITITNMPIARWRNHLDRQGDLADYLDKLESSFNAANVQGLMCRHQIHIDHEGRVHDCDFNYAVGLPALKSEAKGPYLWDLQPSDLDYRVIETADHCFGCTAGHGSSCGGSLS